MRAPILLTLAAALALSACSGSDPIELPEEEPPGVELLDAAWAETQIDTLLLAVSQVSDAPIFYEELYDVTDSGAEPLIAHYDDWLTEQGWERLGSSAAIDGALGASWERDGQDVVIALLNVDDTAIAAVFVSPQA
ncbi:hypothetical protein [Ornithinimicrobium faecis]|uniref:DUF3887 domain-containing protein n=1 Tax=Ornithinimicrobium faecis TaxID=2934158 RepID=A0ABY4YRY4_9MICO|nr:MULTISPECIES: hypothetical protein [unclassified Ornithinimicrobium]USQ79501.1 hypothetical protein NF556_18175 [Ornithinimicrobium sp. HY1793]